MPSIAGTMWLPFMSWYKRWTLRRHCSSSLALWMAAFNGASDGAVNAAGTWHGSSGKPLLIRAMRQHVEALPDFGAQVFVLHFPGMIQHVKGGVPNQEAEWPGSGKFALRVECPNSRAIGIAVRLQVLRRSAAHPGAYALQLLCPLLFAGKHMAHDVLSNLALLRAAPSPTQPRHAHGPRRNMPSTLAAGPGTVQASGDISRLSLPEKANEMPQKSVEPVPG